MLGTLIWGMVSASAQAQKNNVAATDSISPSIPERELITCYKPAIPPKGIKSPTDTVEVKGKVLDEEGEPVIGSSIKIKNKNEGTVSDLDGNFSLNAGIQDIIVVSLLGFKPAEFTASSVKDSITVTLKTDSVNLTCYIVVERKLRKRTISPIKTDEREIKGKVRDEFGDFLMGVAVKVKGTTNGVITDIDGSFSIMAKSSDKLVFSFLGMETKEISASILNGERELFLSRILIQSFVTKSLLLTIIRMISIDVNPKRSRNYLIPKYRLLPFRPQVILKVFRSGYKRM
ncbi:carboxypeptidase-like regulatory domain-containing protein [Dysgonomonas sp. Marseille-P4361]|uniref:carboxypeptidase-like regulatory domain-containing protein n=1 Tax=Dysgonomonas sp. Marseille-P4361 TaxID=2161820 RepID=UPI000D55914A|nr:carboxypeptidase-like regulatory domain-containing protein [Dysgonomonas sp. Marseille-P4361]